MEDMGALWLANTPPESSAPDTGVPLWAFLSAAGFAVLAAIITPIVTNFFNQRTLRQQHEHERSIRQVEALAEEARRLEEHKRRIYDEVLQAVGGAQLGIVAERKNIITVQAQMARIWPVASALVLVRAERLNKASVALAGSNKDDSKEEWRFFLDAVQDFCAAVRDEFSGNSRVLDTGSVAGLLRDAGLDRDGNRIAGTGPEEPDLT